MAQAPPKKPRRTRTRTACCFSVCFGTRRSDEETQLKTRSNGGDKLRISWFYWSRIKNSAAKTVPVETSAALVSSTVEAEKKQANDRFNKPPNEPKPKPDRISSKSRTAKQAAATAADAAPPARPPEGEGDREVRDGRVLGTGNPPAFFTRVNQREFT